MTMATDYNNRLITPDLEKAMKDYPLYSQDSKKKDALCIAVFFIGNARWYILEGQRENDTATFQPTKWQVWLWTHPSTDSVQSW